MNKACLYFYFCKLSIKKSVSKKENIDETPLMRQYNDIKTKYPDALLLFRVGDFYETFGEDAIKASQILGIVLTRRANGKATYIELAGFPYHSLDAYLPKLVRAGQRVAICEQLEDPKMTKKIVKRGVTDIITPGVSYNDKVLEQKKNNFLASIFQENETWGIAFIDVSTGEYFIAQGNWAYCEKLIQSFRPSEIILPKKQKKTLEENLQERFYLYGLDDWMFTFDYTYEKLIQHFQTKSLKGFGIETYKTGIIAAGAILQYLGDIQSNNLNHVTSISRIDEQQTVWLDRFTIRNLEIFDSPNYEAKTLIDVLDQTISPMGARLLKRWLALPLKDVQQIINRQQLVSYFFENKEVSQKIKDSLKVIGDLDRLISKAALGRINPREVIQLKRSLSATQFIKELIDAAENESLKRMGDQLNPCKVLWDEIEKMLEEEAPVAVNKGNCIKKGVNEELDELKNISNNGKDFLIQIQTRESQLTGIPSLKVSFNNVFGYYIEVTNTHKDKVPDTWIRKQTLVNAERYITEELKEYESKILGAEEKIAEIEIKIFNHLVLSINEYIQPIQLNSQLLASLDCLCNFAEIAKQNNYICPEINESKVIDIKEGRHPVIEKQLPIGEEYVSNNVYLDDKKQQILMITGPNMSGKSALLRQTALIVLLAQVGSFVPASAAKIGIVDKIFTRVGASDNISSGESTFMVEMNETASILNNISNRSLILLDEIGRGTSTYDGISIAWAIAEFLHENGEHKPKTLFATHYHELNEMANLFDGVKNFNVSVKEANNKIIFLRKLKEGGSEHSFGIHVARMAGIPKVVTERANEILLKLEKSHNVELTKKAGKAAKQDMQLSFFQLNDPVLEQIREEIEKVDVNNLTPMEALLKLNEIKKWVGA